MNLVSFIDNVFNNLINLNRNNRKLLIIISDLLLVLISLLITIFLLTDNSLINIHEEYIKLIIFSPIVSFLIYNFSGQYIGITKYISNKYFYQILYRNIFISLTIFTFAFPDFNLYPNIKFVITFFIVNSLFTVLLRIILKEILFGFNFPNKKIKNVIIYGAGEAGAQLSYALKFNKKIFIYSFIDDNKSLHGRVLDDILIRSPNDIPKMASKIDQVLLAMPSINNARRIKIVSNLKKSRIPVMEIPSFDDLTNGRASIDRLKPVNLESLLGRESSQTITDKCKEMIKDKIIVVTGAGGSIGAELCRQIIYLKPKKLIAIENNEHNLYKLEKEINDYLTENIEKEFLLVNVVEEKYLQEIFKLNKVDYVFHAAAYKHVNLVEKNPFSSVFNNIFSTLSICKASFDNNVKNIVLISSDKSVRPSNLMGVTKRVSELIFQSYNAKSKLESFEKNKQFSCFSIVRFGNVIGSSGSVIPLFLDQISKGGPITLTDPKVIRYFMTISEASQLVLESTSLANGGEAFILDMGKPVLIKDLAEQIIKLSGLEVKDENNPYGDIEIINTGLKPGEKLYEELFIDNNPKKTNHPSILKTTELGMPYDSLIAILEDLEKTALDLNYSKLFKILFQLVPEWKMSNYIKKLVNKVKE